MASRPASPPGPTSRAHVLTGVSKRFFEQVADAVVGFLPPDLGSPLTRYTSGNVKLWFGDEARQHYEAQFIRRDGSFEIGFHAEHRFVEENETVIDRLLEQEPTWRPRLGPDAEAGPFLGMPDSPWRRLSEVGSAPRPLDVEAALDVADRLATYAEVLEPLRRG